MILNIVYYYASIEFTSQHERSHRKQSPVEQKKRHRTELMSKQPMSPILHCSKPFYFVPSIVLSCLTHTHYKSISLHVFLENSVATSRESLYTVFVGFVAVKQTLKKARPRVPATWARKIPTKARPRVSATSARKILTKARLTLLEKPRKGRLSQKEAAKRPGRAILYAVALHGNYAHQHHDLVQTLFVYRIVPLCHFQSL